MQPQLGLLKVYLFTVVKEIYYNKEVINWQQSLTDHIRQAVPLSVQ